MTTPPTKPSAVLSAERFGFLLGQIEGRTPPPIDMANGFELSRSHETLRSLLAERDAEIARLARAVVGWKALADCHEPVSDYRTDIQFFHDAPATWIAVPPGHFCIFFPEDAHAPLVGEGIIRKVIFKIAVE